ncbi:B12-binding domain-containing radical SAM protein [Candidatus Bathyarchaeota archaeon]|nr:MAG: B12-binding domain-containing radical SAM protein [Candidatus Bathyarchaeota archaeon]
MKVLLVQPPLTPEIELYSTAGIVAPPLGLAYLAAVLEKYGYPVEILDAPALEVTFKDLAVELKRRKPDLVGITATTATISNALQTAKVTKEVLPESIVMMGGAHITFTHETLMKENPFVDVGCIGEGEYTLLEFVKTVENEGNLKNVKGIIFRKDGKILKTEPRPLIENLDDLPFPARHLLPMNRYKAFRKKMILGTILTSRGCPFNCIFCSSSLLFGKKFRARSPKNVVDEIEQFQETYKTRYVEFVDDTFTFDKKRAEAICKEILDRKLDTQWVCSCRVDLINKELMKTLKKAGCIMIYFGVESGVQRVLNILKKGIKIEQAVRVMKWAREVGLETVASFVLGTPGETWEDALQTIKFAKKLDPDYVQFSIATPFPGTELYEIADREGLLLTRDWSQYTVLKPVMRTKELTVEQLQKLIRKAYFSFYLRPKVIFRYLRKKHFKELVVNVLGNYLWQNLKAKIGLQDTGKLSSIPT